MKTELLQKALDNVDLTRDEASSVMDAIMSGESSASWIAGFLIAMKKKGERPHEVAGFVDSMRRHAVKITLKDTEAVDGCGTGGDGSHSFNISTAAAIVASAAGATVAKHGNRSISSRCGSADLLEAAGGNIDPGAEKVTACINDCGFGFMFAPRFHPAMKHAASPRKELGVRTVFNILGPMTNPAGVRRQVIGVYEPELMELMAEVLAMTGSVHILVVHARDGMDELSVCAPTDYVEYHMGQMKRGAISVAGAGLDTFPPGALAGGDAGQNVKILNEILRGKRSCYRDAVLLNAGALLYVAARADSVTAGVKIAAKAVDDGNARKKFEQWIVQSNE